MKPAVVIPVYGRWDLVSQAVRSIKDTCDADVILVDDAGPSSCPGNVRIDADLVWRHPVNQGFAAACNTGTQLADGCDVVVFVNSDVVALPGWLDPLVLSLYRAVIAGPTICAPSGRVQTTGVAVDFTQPFGREAAEITHPTDTGPRDAVTGACMAVLRDWLVDAGGFDQDFVNGYEDVDLCLRARGDGGEVWHVAESVVEHLGNGSGSHRWTHVQDNIRRLREKWA